MSKRSDIKYSTFSVLPTDLNEVSVANRFLVQSSLNFSLHKILSDNKESFLYFSSFISPLKVNEERIHGCVFLYSPCYRYTYFLCFVNRASLYNLLNKANLVHNLFLVYLSISAGFGQLCAHHQKEEMCLCETWYLLFCVDDCLVFIPPCIPDSHPHRITSTKCRINTVASPDDGHIVARNM